MATPVGALAAAAQCDVLTRAGCAMQNIEVLAFQASEQCCEWTAAGHFHQSKTKAEMAKVSAPMKFEVEKKEVTPHRSTVPPHRATSATVLLLCCCCCCCGCCCCCRCGGCAGMRTRLRPVMPGSMPAVCGVCPCGCCWFGGQTPCRRWSAPGPGPSRSAIAARRRRRPPPGAAAGRATHRRSPCRKGKPARSSGSTRSRRSRPRGRAPLAPGRSPSAPSRQAGRVPGV